MLSYITYATFGFAEILATYYFADSNFYHDLQSANEFSQTTVDSVAVFSATQLNAFSKLGLLSKVIAISESEYIRNPVIRELYSSGQLVELAGNGNFYLFKWNVEILFL